MIKDIRDMQEIGQEKATADYLKRFRKPMPTKTAEMTVEAEINHGRWICKCPFCKGAEIADRQDKRFFCLSCFNKSIAGQWLKVEFPKDEKKIEIELSKRPKVENRNWIPSESVNDLRRENKERGIK